jgi:hypothetical protein
VRIDPTAVRREGATIDAEMFAQVADGVTKLAG